MPTAARGRTVVAVAIVASIALTSALAWAGRDYVRFVSLYESLGRNAEGYSEYRHRKTGIVFVWLPRGTFTMGSPPHEEDRHEDEGPLHTVTVSPFLIAKYEMTQAEWERAMGQNPSPIKGADLPVSNVSWEDCQELEARTGLGIPTEAEWEYACRAGSSEPFGGSGLPDAMGWHRGNSELAPQPVGQKLPNDFGLHDMHGNVSEWCGDWFDEAFYASSFGAIDSVAGDEKHGTRGRVLRGGCWYYFPGNCRSAFRYAEPPSYRSEYVGLRPVGRWP